MNKYIILTANIIPVGGMQLYTKGKACFLQERGWDVKILYDGDRYSSCDIQELNKYRNGAFPIISYRPMDLPKIIVKHALNRIISFIGEIDSNDKIYIESQSDILAFWGELIAKELNGQHLCFNCNELFRGYNKFYDSYIDYFYFKYKRKELLGLHEDTHKKIFSNYYNVPCGKTLMFDALEPDPIQNVNSEVSNNIKTCDYNIAYLGRVNKGYFENIMNGIKNFALLHPDKTINCIIIGDETDKRTFLHGLVTDCKNIQLTPMGNLVPIPRSIFNKIDLMIAGAVCAEISAREGVPTIVADCENYLANGVLGYTVMNSMYFDPKIGQTDFCTAIENTLIKENYKLYTYTFPDAPKSDDVYESQFDFFESANREKKYYNFIGKCKYTLKDVCKAAIKEFFDLKYANSLHKKTLKCEE